MRNWPFHFLVAGVSIAGVLGVVAAAILLGEIGAPWWVYGAGVLLLLGALISGLIWWGATLDRRRAAALAAVASSLGFEFVAEPDLDQLPGRNLPLFNQGHLRAANNLMAGVRDGERVLILDYQYMLGAGRRASAHVQTVALFPGGAVGLPAFQVAPLNLAKKVAVLFGLQHIDVESHPAFSSRYLLRGENEAAIRAAFTPRILEFFAGRGGWTVEARRGDLAAYALNWTRRPKDIPAFLADTLEVRDALASGSPSSPCS